MIAASFSTNRSLKKVLPKDSVPISEVNRYLEEIDKYAEDNAIKANSELVLRKDGKIIFRDDVKFGIRSSYVQSVLLLVKHTLDTVFKDQPEPEKEALINLISSEINESNKKQSEAFKDDKESISKDTHEPNNQNDDQDSQVLDTPLEQSKPMKRSEYQVNKVNAVSPLPTKVKLPAIKISSSDMKKMKKYLFSMVVGLFCIFAMIWGYRTIQAHVANKDTYSVLIQNKEYDKAATKYPKHLREVEQTINEKASVNTLRAFNQKHPTQEGAFDLAFKEKNWKKVLEYRDVKFNIGRKAQLAVAYLKTDDPESAELLNRQINDDDLSSAIGLKYVQLGKFDQARNLNKQLKSNSLSKLIDTGEIYQQAIEKYKVDANNNKLSKAQRDKALDNQKNWERQLSSIGE